MVLQSVCRLCLATDARMLDIAGGPLQVVYQKLTSFPLHKSDRPVVACYLCHYQLRKTHELMVKSRKADFLLTEICLNASVLTRESIANIDRKANRLHDLRSETNIVSIVIMDSMFMEKELKDEVVTKDVASTNIDNGMIEKPPDQKIPLVQDIKFEDNVSNETSAVMEDTERKSCMDLEEVYNEESEEAEEFDIKEEPMDFEENELMPKQSLEYLDSEGLKGIGPDKSEPTHVAIQHQVNAIPIHNKANEARIEETLNNDINIDMANNKISESTSSYSEMLNRCYSSKLLGKFVCDFCGDKFTRKYLLIEHRKLNHGINKSNTSNEKKPHGCTFCHLRFGQRNTLFNHLKTHTGEKPFQCNICEQRFRQISNLNSHLRVHTGEKPFQCGICDNRFSLKITLNNHLKTHTGEKPFKCDICQRGFCQRAALDRHLKTHTGEKPFNCSICLRSFSQKNNLNNHLKIHTGDKPFSCGICQQSFGRKDILKYHLKIHTGEKPFNCEFCERRFRSKYDLKRHLSIHARNEPIQCWICHTRFSHKDTLSEHLRIHDRESMKGSSKSDNDIYII